MVLMIAFLHVAPPIVLGQFPNQQVCEREHVRLLQSDPHIAVVCVGPNWREDVKRFEFRP